MQRLDIRLAQAVTLVEISVRLGTRPVSCHLLAAAFETLLERGILVDALCPRVSRKKD